MYPASILCTMRTIEILSIRPVLPLWWCLAFLFILSWGKQEPHRSIPVRMNYRAPPPKLDRATKALPEASRRAEDHLRQAFFAEVGAVLTSLGAAPALRAPKQLHGDAGVCLRCRNVARVLFCLVFASADRVETVAMVGKALPAVPRVDK